MKTTTKPVRFAGIVITLLTAGLRPANGVTVYSDNFTGGPGAATGYWASNTDCNGYGVTSTNSSAVCGGAFEAVYTSGDPTNASYEITAGVGGTSYFLFDGTNTTAPSSPLQAFYISTGFAVQDNTEYTISFYLTNADAAYGNDAVVQLEMNGVAVGSPVQANGFYTDGNAADQWQLETISWNSQTGNSPVTLSLVDSTTSGAGNDFGIAMLSVQTAAPEPGTFSLLGVVAVGLLDGLRRRCPR
jgi:hypothetical protein